MYKSRNSNKGFGVIEMVVVTGIVSMTLFAFLQTSILAIKLLRAEKENLEATLLAQEAMEAARSIRDESWANNIASLANGTRYYPMVENGKWKLKTISPGLINGKYDRYVIFSEVRRDAQDKIASGGTLDPNTKKITTYTEYSGKTKTIVSYMTNFVASLGGATETLVVSFVDATTDADLGSFPSNNSGDGDPAQSFTTLTSSIAVSKIELYLRRTTTSPSDIYVELRQTPTGAVLGTSNTITGFTISTTSPAWVEFRFNDPVSLNALTLYYMRLRSSPSSTDTGSGSAGTLNWSYQQTASSPYLGGKARRYVGRLSNPGDAGQELDQYDYGFKVYALQ
jgi:type II secretory pathway pseudopilin PulG